MMDVSYLVRISRTLACCLTLLVVGCDKDNGDDGGSSPPPPSSGPVSDIEDTSEAGMVSFVKAGTYTSWTAKQPTVVDSVSSHGGKARTYFNDTAAAAAKAGETTLPVGSILVKELYKPDGATLKGHAAMVKVEATTGGNSWLWFEGFGPDYTKPYYGIGHNDCIGCHSTGLDFVRTTVPSS